MLTIKLKLLYTKQQKTLIVKTIGSILYMKWNEIFQLNIDKITKDKFRFQPVPCKSRISYGTVNQNERKKKKRSPTSSCLQTQQQQNCPWNDSNWISSMLQIQIKEGNFWFKKNEQNLS